MQTAPPAHSYGRCPYCQTECYSGEEVGVCPGCNTAHHKECWNENRGCSMFGCAMAPPTEKRGELEIPVSYWGRENKPCPSCGREILAAAVRCRFCGARFASARVVDSREYDEQQTIRKRHPALRRTVVVLLVLDVLTCSAPVAAVISYFWYRGNRRALMSLPLLYSSLIKIGIGVGAGQTALFIIMGIVFTFVR